jgi:hypothetical protein
MNLNSHCLRLINSKTTVYCVKFHSSIKKIPYFAQRKNFDNGMGMIFKRIAILLFLLIQCINVTPKGQINHASVTHELIFYVIPSPDSLQWNSPATLFKSYYSSYKKHFFEREKYLMGHLFVCLKTPLLQKPLFLGIGASSKSEQRHLMLKEKIGFSILKTHLKGRLETEDELIKKIPIYKSRGELALIRFNINIHAIERILTFIDTFTQVNENNHSPSAYYGGTFYPRFQNEGSGCTALGMAMLELCGVDLSQFSDWKVDVNIPMEIIGGVYNNHNKVGLKKIKQAHKWHDDNGVDEVDFISHYVYDPTLMFRFVKEHTDKQLGTTDLHKNIPSDNLPELIFDFSNLTPKSNEPVILNREKPSLFIEHFNRAIGINKHETSSNSE